MELAGKIAKYTGLTVLWMFQYCFAVWFILAGRFCAAALKFGAWGLLMLCIPIVGWIILAVKIVHVMSNNGPKRPSVFKPWGVK